MNLDVLTNFWSLVNSPLPFPINFLNSLGFFIGFILILAYGISRLDEGSEYYGRSGTMEYDLARDEFIRDSFIFLLGLSLFFLGLIWTILIMLLVGVILFLKARFYTRNKNP
jgi:ABC-type antimicrobial peptide transport system permease subunit